VVEQDTLMTKGFGSALGTQLIGFNPKHHTQRSNNSNLPQAKGTCVVHNAALAKVGNPILMTVNAALMANAMTVSATSSWRRVA
jgi:hypothetical protein